MNEAITALDSALAEAGEWVIVRRVVGTGNSAVNIDVRCRARTDGVTEQQLIAGISATTVNFIMSPTQIQDAQWPGATSPQLPPFEVDQSIPRVNDKLIVGGVLKTISFIDTMMKDGDVVRINGRAN